MYTDRFGGHFLSVSSIPTSTYSTFVKVKDTTVHWNVRMLLVIRS